MVSLRDSPWKSNSVKGRVVKNQGSVCGLAPGFFSTLKPLTLLEFHGRGGEQISRARFATLTGYFGEPGRTRRREHTMSETVSIHKEPLTVKCWEGILTASEIEALHDYGHTNPHQALTPDEVLEIIVNWNGGIATAYHIKRIISRVYEIEL